MELIASAAPLFACPDREMLVEFDHGKLPAHDVDVISGHLAVCERCEGFLHDIQTRSLDDEIIALLKRCMQGPPIPDERVGATDKATTETLVVTFTNPTGRALPIDRDRAAPQRALTGTIGPYALHDRIGQGGMGVVYRAQQVPLKRMVALKMISAGHHAGSQTIARFIREGKAVARLRHPNVVQIYDLGESEGLPYYAMELVEGGNLQAKLADGRFEPRAAAELVRTLAEAVDYAHQEGVVHRDLKPANILLTATGAPKITDFGLAKMLDADSEGLTTAPFTASNMVLGTPNYMAPEQAEGRVDEIGRATDVYALGSILYALLIGRPPFAGATKVKILRFISSGAPTPPSRLRAEVPFWLEAICLKCLEKKPSNRYPTAQALADDLALWLRDERPRGTPGWLARLGRGVRRQGVAVLIILAPFSAGAALYLNHPDRTIQRYEDRLARGKPVTLIGATGNPGWYRWQAGKSRSQMVLAEDGTCTIHSWTRGLVELLADPRCESYRFAAQVRHEKSDLTGEVGIYLAHRAHPGAADKIHNYMLMSFNDVRSDAEIVARLLGDPRRPTSRENVVKLSPCLYSDEAVSPHVDRLMSGAYGPHFRPGQGFVGGKNERWHDLEVIVTPERLTGRWDGQPFSISRAEIARSTTENLTSHPYPQPGPLRPGFRPALEGRGGLGLYVWRGSASFRAVTVTPL